jgi:hypothetical protein
MRAHRCLNPSLGCRALDDAQHGPLDQPATTLANTGSLARLRRVTTAESQSQRAHSCGRSKVEVVSRTAKIGFGPPLMKRDFFLGWLGS